jgi:hypothetical protein
METLNPASLDLRSIAFFTRRKKLVKTSSQLYLKLVAAAALAFAPLTALPTWAQSASTASQQVVPYDVAKETRVQGTIQSIDSSGAHLPVGTHILVQTTAGVVDAHLGPLTKGSLDALNLSVGESVALTGMDEALPGGNVFLVRILTTSSRVIILRNEHGFPVRSLLPRGSFHSAAMEKEGL